MKNKKSAFEIELLHEISDFNNDDVDALVNFGSGEVRSVTFFTLKRIQQILAQYRESGECLSGTFFWAKDLVIVKDLSPETLRATIDDMVETGEYAVALGRIEGEH